MLVIGLIIVMNDLVLFVELLVKSRQNHLFPQGAVKKPDQNHILDDGPTKFSHDVTWVGEDAPGFFPNRHRYFFMPVLCCHKNVHGFTLSLIDNDCQYRGTTLPTSGEAARVKKSSPFLQGLISNVTNPKPKGHYGAVELLARYSRIDLDSATCERLLAITREDRALFDHVAQRHAGL